MFKIEDDGPTASIETVSEASITLDETIGGADTPDDDDVFTNPFPFGFGTPIGLVSDVDLVDDTTDFGADGPGTRTVALTIASIGIYSGLDATGLGAINLYVEGDGTVTGRVGASDGDVAFAISINDSGEVTVAQYLAIDHGDDGNDHDSSVSLDASVLSAIVTVTDGDDDVASDSVDIGVLINFEDDGPVAGTAQTLILRNDLDNTGTGDLDFTIGSDVPGETYSLTMAMDEFGAQVDFAEDGEVWGRVDGTLTRMTSDGIDLIWTDNGDGSWSAVRDDESAGVVFTVSVNSDDGTYMVVLDDPLLLDGGAAPFVLDFTQAVDPGNTVLLVAYDSTADDLDPADGIPDGATIMALAVGTSQNGDPGEVNTSKQGMGVDNNSIDASGTTSENLDLFFSNPVDQATINGPGDLDPLAIDFITITLDHLTTIEFALVSVHVDGVGEVWFKVQGIGGPSDDTVFTIEQGTTGDGSLGGDGTFGDPWVVDMTSGTGTALVDGEFDHLHFQADADSGTGYRMLTAEGQGGSFGFDLDTTFTAEAMDGDGDTVTTTFNVTFDSGPILDGTDGDDVINGNAPGESEILVGGLGDDILTGNGGNDIFDYNADNEGVDVITDFVKIAGDDQDIIDIADLFDGTGGAGLSVTALVSGGFLELDASADAGVGDAGTNDTVISVDTTGSGNFSGGALVIVQDITLLITDTSNFDNVV